MKRLFALLFILTFATFGFAQNDIYTSIKSKKVVHFLALERKNKNTLFRDSETYISLNQDLAQPIIYRRKEKVIPDLLVFYNFSKTDSLIDHVLYEWDIKNFEKDEVRKSLAYDVLLIKKYNELLGELTTLFGKSVSKGSLKNLAQIETKEGLAQSDDWKPNDSTEIKLYTYISNYQEKNEFTESRPTRRIRLYIYNVRKKAKPGAGPAQIAAANSNFQAFMRKLKVDDFTGAKSYLANQTSTNTTDAQLKVFKDLVKFDEKTKVFNHVFPLTPSGPIHLILQYKYENDLESPPLAIIEVSFDAQQKMLGAKPLKRELSLPKQ